MPAHQSNQSGKPPSKPARITPLAILHFRLLTLTNQHYSEQKPAKHLGCLPSTLTSLENAPLPLHSPTQQPTHPHVIIQQHVIIQHPDTSRHFQANVAPTGNSHHGVHLEELSHIVSRTWFPWAPCRFRSGPQCQAHPRPSSSPAYLETGVNQNSIRHL